jgi:multiple sugar transport system substrate-binding protein
MASHDDVAYSPLAFGYTNYSRQGYHRNILRYGLIPERNNALLGGAGIAVSVYSKTIKEASTYAAWLCSEEYQCRQYVIAGGQPAHIKAWTNSLANEIAGNFFSDTMSTLERAYVRPRNRKWPDFQERLGEIIHAGLTNRHHTEDIWNQIVKTYDDFFWIA